MDFHAAGLSDRDWRIFDTSLEFPEGTIVWDSINELSEKGEISRFNQTMEKGWGVARPATTHQSSGYSGATSAGGNSASKPGTSKPTGLGSTQGAIKAKTSKADEGEDEEGIVVELELGADDDSLAGLTTAKSLGACVHFNTINEIADGLGVEKSELSLMSVIEVANRAHRLGFHLGYAVSTTDNSEEKGEVLRKGRETTKSLEKATGKWHGATAVIWEQKVILIVILALIKSGYGVSVSNIAKSLEAFPKLTIKRRGDLVRTAALLLRDDEVRGNVKDLMDAYKRAEGKNVPAKENVS